MCAAPFVMLGAVVILGLSPLAIPLLPVVLWYLYREKRAGRAVVFRLPWGITTNAEAEASAEVEPPALAEPDDLHHAERPESLEAHPAPHSA